MKERADKVLADLGLSTTRSQAKVLIENGDVKVNGIVIKKAGELIETTDDIQVSSKQFVGRGALKLEKALNEFQIPVKDLIFLDVGASTGGFTEILLLNGVKKVYAIDVGHDQLAQKLKTDPRVINLEGTNVRELESLPEIAHAAVMDLSFISVTKVLDRVHTLIAPLGNLVVLVKPQFEAGRDRLPKDGVIKDFKVQEAVLKEVLEFAESHGWKHMKTIDSPIEGKSGNREFLSWLIRV